MNRAMRRAEAKAKARGQRSMRHGITAVDPITFALAGNAPLPASRAAEMQATVESWVAAMRTGKATPDDMLGLYGSALMVRSLVDLGSRGKQGYSLPDDGVIDRVILAIDRMSSEALETGRFVCRVPDLKDVLELVDLHRQLYEVALQSDLEKATRLMMARIRSRKVQPTLMQVFEREGAPA